MKHLYLNLILGIIFFISGMSKSFDVASFSYEVALYTNSFLYSWLIPWATPIAFTICAIEIFVGLLSISNLHAKISSIIILCMLFLFTWLTAMNFFSLDTNHYIESCGCFGDFFTFSPFASLVKCLALLVMAFTMGFITFSSHNEKIEIPFFKDNRILAFALYGIALPLYSLEAKGHLHKTFYAGSYIIIAIIGMAILRKTYKKAH